MIIENKITTLNNEVVKVNKKKVPRSINPDLVPLFFTSCFVGSKNSGKTYGLVKMLKNFELYPVYDVDKNKLENRIILICPTAGSSANPIYTTLKDLDPEDIYTEYNDDILQSILDDIKREKDEITEREKYVKVFKKFLKIKSLHTLTDDEIMILEKYDYTSPDELQPLKYDHPPVIFLILDDMIGNNACFKRGNCLISNLTIKHRHLGINLIYTTQNPKSIPNIIRANIDLWVLYKFSNVNIILNKCYEEVSSLINEDNFINLYLHATEQPYNSFVIDTHPLTENSKRFKKNFDVILSLSN
jgi:hypothetical protein